MKIKLVTLAFVMVTSPVWAETTTSLSTGFDFTSGKYGGTTATNILYIPVTGKVQFENLYLKLTVPYIRVSSAGSGVVRGMGSGKISTKTTTTTQSGLGDVVASAGYTFYETDDVALDLVGNIKFGTADPDKDLGTGKNDYSAQIDGFYTMKATSLFATAGYKIVGAPAGVSVNNIVYGTIGLSQKISDISSIGIAFDAAQSSSELSPGTREASVFVAHKISKTEKVQASVMKGFSDGSPDFGFGVSVTGTF
jgi:hypothetical protein